MTGGSTCCRSLWEFDGEPIDIYFEFFINRYAPVCSGEEDEMAFGSGATTKRIAVNLTVDP